LRGAGVILVEPPPSRLQRTVSRSQVPGSDSHGPCHRICTCHPRVKPSRFFNFLFASPRPVGPNHASPGPPWKLPFPVPPHTLFLSLTTQPSNPNGRSLPSPEPTILRRSIHPPRAFPGNIHTECPPPPPFLIFCSPLSRLNPTLFRQSLTLFSLSPFFFFRYDSA